MGIAVGILELKSIARGFLVADTCLKTAPIELKVRITCPGKSLLLMSGEISAVQSAVETGNIKGNESVINYLVLGNLHPDVLPALAGVAQIRTEETLGIIETFSISGAIKAADITAKAGQIQLLDVRPAQGLGGKGFVLLAGKVGAVEAAVEAAKQYLIETGDLVDAVVIPSPHRDLWDQIV